ncbi:MAG: ABC transporter permease [Candidatus Zixiibacteriota bacterium]|nr:MAG: ABC transporter permease [candidate division Zixibacteria bacterium]
MSFEGFIARRYFTSGRYFISVSTWITIAGVTLGVAVVCFVMSMHNGFESEIRTRLLGTTSHISIFPAGTELIHNYQALVEQVESIDGVVAASPFIYAKAAIQSENSGDGIVVRGIVPDQEARTANIQKDIQFGEYTFESQVIDDDTLTGIILGRGLASRLSVLAGGTVVLYSMSGEDLRRNVRPRVKKFYVSGIFETGMYEFDGQQAYISLEDAQDLFRVGDAVTGVHLRLTDIYDAEEISPVIDSHLAYRYQITPWNQLHRNLFSWIAFEKKILFLGFILIVIVAAFSIISTLVMMTMEKRAEIGILKTIGSTPGSIRRIFVRKGILIGTLGLVGGWLIALGAAYIQNRFQLISLPPDIYFISYLPIETHLVDFLLAGAITVLICFLAALYPANQAARVSVIDVLRQ